MLSDTERASLSDILFNIGLANSFAEGFDYERFLADMRTFYAITRCLEIISEASRRLSPEIKARHPDIPWRKVSGSGNIYRHDYEDVVHRLVWGTVHEFLPALRGHGRNRAFTARVTGHDHPWLCACFDRRPES
jgi:uncharacterized protein with HEPN domain